MKIKDVVFMVNTDDRSIIKTKILGIQDKLDKDDNGKEYVHKFYLVKGKDAGYRSNDENWVDKENLYLTLEGAQEVISNRIQKEIIEELDKISITDYSGEK